MENGASSYRRFLDGDDTGFVEIVRDYKDGLILYLNSLVSDRFAAEELAEDTFVKLGVKRPQLKDASAFKTWLYAIGRYTAIDYIRRRTKEKTTPLDTCGELPGEWQIETAYIKEEQKRIVHRAMGRLKQEYRQVLWLIYFEQFSTKETARIMKKSVHNIETLAYRARQSLKAELGREGFTYEDL